MDRYVEDPQVQIAGCGVLAGVAAGHVQNRAAVASVTGLVPVVAALHAHIGDTAVQRAGLKAVVHLTPASDYRRAQLKEADEAPKIA